MKIKSIKISGLFISSHSPSFILQLTTTTANQSITLPHLHDDGAGYNYVHNYTVDYGDNSGLKKVVSYNDTNCTHIYSTIGTYLVKIFGTCETFYTNYTSIRLLITKVLSWGMIGIKVVSFWGCQFMTSIPPDILGSFSLVQTFGGGDTWGSFQGCNSLTSLPLGLFDHCVWAWDFERTFYSCGNLISIPAGLFDHCVMAANFHYTFEGCNSLTSIPAGLFDHCPDVFTFRHLFEATAISSIPAGLFDHCPIVTDMSYVFRECMNLTSIPTGLFDHCPLVDDFSYVFEGCINISTIPVDLFKYNLNVYNFYDAFLSCRSLTSIPAGLFDHCQSVTTFYECFSQCYALTGLAPDLWNTHSGATGTFCFSYDTSLSNYYDIPINWGGPPAMSGDPASLIISVISPTEIDLSWTDNVTNEQGYKIERSVNDDSHYSVIDSIPANSNTYTGTSLNPSTLYYYRVRAYKGSSTYSNYTNSVSGTTYVIPIAPSGLTGIPSTTEATVDNFTFTNNSPNCEGIRVYISPDGEEWFEFIDISPLSGDATGFSLTNLFPPDFSLGYRYVKISAFSGTLESGYSNIVEGSQYDAINTIGTDTGDFTTLYDAIDFINEGNAIGNILYKVIENTIETESVILYESGYEGLSISNYLSYNIRTNNFW